ncbi:MAG: methyltransferase domain-containing protein [Bdellovibrionales bacterium]
MSETLYDENFYAEQAPGSLTAAATVLPTLFWLLGAPPRSLVDVGCGIGTWLKQAQAMGVREIVGLDGDYVPSNRLLINPSQFIASDLRGDFSSPLNRRFGMAMSLEVAEHLPADRAQNFVAQLASLSDLVLFSAAMPRQGGTGHVHENWAEYWALHFAMLGYACFDPLRELYWTEPKVPWWYAQNVLVFARGEISAQLERFRAPFDRALTRIHPVGRLCRGGEPPLMGDPMAEVLYYQILDRLWRAGKPVLPPLRPLPISRG